MPDDLEEALDRLYGLPAEEFTAARDALARELRGARRRDEADAVRRHRRPTAPAAAINQLARREPERVDELIRATRDLVEVQERLLAGEAGRDELRAAADAERRAVGALVSAASGLPDPPSPAALEKVRATLHAAATDDEVRAAIAGGRVEREAEPAGAWGAFALGGGIEAPPTARGATGAGAKRSARKGSAERTAAEEATATDAAAAAQDQDDAPTAADRTRERRARKRAEALERARAEDAAAQRELAEAESAAAAAHEVLEAAAERAEAARAAVVDAEAAEDEARSAAQRTLRALKRAEAVAADTAEKVARLEGG